MSTFQLQAIEKLRQIVIWVFMFTVPIFFLHGCNAREAQESYFQFMCMIVASLYFGNIWLMLFMWLNIFLLVQSGFVGTTQVISVFMTGLLFVCSRNFFSSDGSKKLRKVIIGLYLAAFISVVFVILQHFRIDPLAYPMDAHGKVDAFQAVNQPNGMLGLPPFNAIFLTITASLMLFLGGWWGVLFLIPVYITHCSAAYLAWGFLIPFWFYFRPKFVKVPFPDFKAKKFNWFRINLFLPIVIIGALGFGFYTFKDFKYDKLTYLSRFESWHLMLRKSGERLMGYGPDSFRQENKLKNFIFRSDTSYNPVIEVNFGEKRGYAYYSANNELWKKRFEGKDPGIRPDGVRELAGWQEAHNDYLQLLFEYGILGVAILFFLLREIYHRFRLSDKTPEVLALFACLCVYALTATTQFPFHLARLSGIFGIILGAYYAFTDKNYQLIKGEENGN